MCPAAPPKASFCVPIDPPGFVAPIDTAAPAVLVALLKPVLPDPADLR